MNNEQNSTKKLTMVAVFIALGLVLSPLLVINLGFAKAYPIQHMVNVFIGVFFGVSYNVGAAFTLSTLRNLLGVGSLLAYPGSMFGAFLSAYLYRLTGKLYMACVGEAVGTGIIGGYVAYLIAAFVLGSKVGAVAMMTSFMASSAAGAAIAGLIITCLPASLKEYLTPVHKISEK